MSGETAGQEQSRAFTEQGVNELRGAQRDFLNDPLYQRERALGAQYANNYQTFTPEVLASIRGAINDNAANTFQGNLGSLWERAGAAGNYRSGETRGAEERLTKGYADTVTGNNRQLDEVVAKQKNVDYAQVLAFLQNVLQQGQQYPSAIAGAYTGGASNRVWEQPSTLAAAGQGLGSIFGTLAGNTNLFGAF